MTFLINHRNNRLFPDQSTISGTADYLEATIINVYITTDIDQTNTQSCFGRNSIISCTSTI